jgi:predicted RNA polymerase sigma factor
MQWNASPVIALNHAVAVAMSGRVEEALARMDELRSAGLDSRKLPRRTALRPAWRRTGWSSAFSSGKFAS